MSVLFSTLPATFADLDALVEVRIAAMRESLERIGRFDPDRARKRLADEFDPSATHWIVVDDRKAGFYVFRAVEDAYRLDHLYLTPELHGQGIGSAMLRHLLEIAAGSSIYVSALRESAANRFYERHGFQQIGESEWDIDYLRPARL